MSTAHDLPLSAQPGFVALSSTVDPAADISPDELRATFPHFAEVRADLIAAMRRNYRARLQPTQPTTELMSVGHARKSA